jgi:hypothetical protein
MPSAIGNLREAGVRAARHVPLRERHRDTLGRDQPAFDGEHRVGERADRGDPEVVVAGEIEPAPDERRRRVRQEAVDVYTHMLIHSSATNVGAVQLSPASRPVVLM